MIYSHIFFYNVKLLVYLLINKISRNEIYMLKNNS